MTYSVRSCICFTVLLAVVVFSQGGAEWVKEPVGSGMGWASSLACGPGRNDGVERIYAGGWQHLYEFTWNGSAWDDWDMGVTQGWGVALGEGRNDTLIRVYATFTVVGPQHGGVYEYTWTGSSWTRTTVASFPSSPSSSAGHAVALGPGRNDGVIRVYSCDCNNDRTFESTWTDSSWNTVQIFDWSATDLIVADGRGDGLYRIYCSHQGSALREYTWSGSTWTFVDLDTSSSSYYDVSVGAGRNDGVVRVYSGNSSFPRSLYEFIWADTIWEKALVGGMPSMPRCVVVGPGRNDGINRLYSGTTGGSRYAREFDWRGTGWDSSWVDSTGGSGSYQDALIGSGRSDGVERLYMGSSDGWVYEFTYGHPGVEEGINDQLSMTNCQLLQSYPNPFTTATTITFSLQGSSALNHTVQGRGAEEQGRNSSTCERINLSIYDLSGRLVKVLADEPCNHPTIGLSNQAVWDGRGYRGEPVPGGVYFCRLRTGSLSATQKLVLLR